MASGFLNSTVIPGTPIAHHEHRKLAIILVAALIVAAAIGIYLWFTPTGQETIPVSTNTQTSANAKVLAQLKGSTPPSKATAQSVLGQLKNK